VSLFILLVFRECLGLNRRCALKIVSDICYSDVPDGLTVPVSHRHRYSTVSYLNISVFLFSVPGKFFWMYFHVRT
jgi:hypothetical protein